MIEELKQRCAGQLKHNQYSAQVIMLHSGSKNFLIRANFWPGAKDSVLRNSGSDPFFYGVAHDHSFSFLTVGYVGPGYWSDYYEYDYGSVVGFVGEKVDLKFVGRERLDPGKVMLYRAHKDVHRQLPADEMSVSLNIMEASNGQEFRDQYQFDIERSQIQAIVNRSALEPLLALSAHLGGENGRDLIDQFASSHPSDRIRFAALKAKASAAGDVDTRLAIYEEAALSPNRFVSEMARLEADKLIRSRSWIETPQGTPPLRKR